MLTIDEVHLEHSVNAATQTGKITAENNASTDLHLRVNLFQAPYRRTRGSRLME